ncbi:unnamed protein product [Ectocarpus sp. 12 AP-2014]
MRRSFMTWSKEWPRALACSAYRVRQIWRRGVLWTSTVRTTYEETHGFGKEKQKKIRYTYSLYKSFGERILVGLKTPQQGYMVVAVCLLFWKLLARLPRPREWRRCNGHLLA